MSVVSRGRKAHTSLAPGVEVSQVEHESLQGVNVKIVVVPEKVVVGRPSCPLDAFMTGQIETGLRWMNDLQVTNKMNTVEWHTVEISIFLTSVSTTVPGKMFPDLRCFLSAAKAGNNLHRK